MLDKIKIQELLGCGLSNEVVADAVGCSPAYIAQLMADADFANTVVLARSKALTSNTARDKKIDSIEDKLISKLEAVIDEDQIYKPRELLTAFNVLNAAKRRGVPAHANMAATKTVVQLILPVALVRQFTMSRNSEVIEVNSDEEGRQTLVTKPTHQLLKELAESAGQDGTRYQEAAKYLPASNTGKV